MDLMLKEIIQLWSFLIYFVKMYTPNSLVTLYDVMLHSVMCIRY